MDSRGETFDYVSSHMIEGGAGSDTQLVDGIDGTSMDEFQPDTPSTLFAGLSGQLQVSSACTSSNSSARTSTTESPSCASLHKIIKKEERAVGRIEWTTIQFYLEVCGSSNVRGLVASLVLALAFNAGGSLWLARWSNANDSQKSENSHASTFYLTIYGLLGVAGVLAMAMSLLFLWMRCTLSASHNTHRQMLHSIFRSPMAFFDSTPIGRILGLFSGDIAQIDDNMPTTSDMGLKALMQAVVAVVLIVISAPLTLLFFLPSAYIYMDLQRRFLPTTRDSKRIANTMRDISLSTTEEAINGAASIRAYGQVSAFETTFMERTELLCRAWWTYMSANRWLAVRLDLVSAGIIFLTTVLLILTQLVAGSVNGSHAGLSLTYALSMIGVLTTCIRCTTIVEMALISVERVRRYSFLDAEAPEVIED
ncbi:ATP-binding cassette glutathione S-conjugate transporter ycf1, partial [Coemansia sp. RSA 2530]